MNTAVARTRMRKTLLILLADRRGHDRPRCAHADALSRLLRSDGLRRNDPARRPRAGRGRRRGQGSFDANVASRTCRGGSSPSRTTVEVAPGAQTKIFYSAQNLSAARSTGQAVYNVSPDTVGKYFKKIQCFCFTEQTLQAGQKVDMPVIFFVDPAITKDPDTKDVHEITLSYTFYPVETGTAAR